MEVTLYDGKGHPIAYITDDNENSIYLWNGIAVAYIDGENIYGWNGQHMGWFVDGVIYELCGTKVGSIAERCPYTTYAQPAKYAKYAKYARYAPYARPIFSSGYGYVNLVDFLNQGAI